MLESYLTATSAVAQRVRIEPDEHVVVLGVGGGIGPPDTSAASAAGATVAIDQST